MRWLLLPLLTACQADDFTSRERPQAGDHPSNQPDDGGADESSDAGSVDSGGSEIDDAVILGVSFPPALDCQATSTAQVRVQNTGTSTWTNAGGYKLGAYNDQDDLYGPDTRVYLADDDSIAPNQVHTFDIPLLAPSSAGTYVSDWGMVREGVAWFGGTGDAQVAVSCQGDTGGGGGGESGGWVCGGGARNGDEVCDDEAFTVPDPSVRVGLRCESATGGVAYVSTNTGPECSDGVNRCQGWEESGQDAWDHLDYIEKTTCVADGQTIELDLSAYTGQTLYVGAHNQPDGSGTMTWGCLATWE
jgi:hypothetical protein